MSISTVEKPEDRRDKVKKLREHHQSLLESVGASNSYFVPKMAYRPYGKTDLHIGFFASEISKGEDVYVEFTSRDLVPEDPERRLYKWRFNPHFEEEYEKTESHPTTGHSRYLIPVEELIIVTPKQEKDLDFTQIPNPDEDLPMDQMTIRDYAAIHMKIPVSHKTWLNNIITNNK
jgi:hypothetical protein